MKDFEAVQLLTTLKAAYPRHQLEQGTTEVYAHDLADMDAGLAQQAVERVRRTSRFFPTIAEIREAAAELVLDAPPPITAWGYAIAFANYKAVWEPCSECVDVSGFSDAEREVICEACRGQGRVNPTSPPPLHPTVAEAYALTADSLAWRETPSPKLRKAFLEAYEEVKRRAVLGIVVPHPSLGRSESRALPPGLTLPALESI